MVLAKADAYVEAFAIHSVPSDRQAVKALETDTQQIAAGTISAIQEELALLAKRTRRPQSIHAGYLNQEINHATRLELNEGKLRLHRQRIKAKTTPAPTPGSRSENTAGLATPPPRDRRVAFRLPDGSRQSGPPSRLREPGGCITGTAKMARVSPNGFGGTQKARRRTFVP